MLLLCFSFVNLCRSPAAAPHRALQTERVTRVKYPFLPACRGGLRAFPAGYRIPSRGGQCKGSVAPSVAPLLFASHEANEANAEHAEHACVVCMAQGRRLATARHGWEGVRRAPRGAGTAKARRRGRRPQQPPARPLSVHAPTGLPTPLALCLLLPPLGAHLTASLIGGRRSLWSGAAVKTSVRGTAFLVAAARHT